MKQNRIIKISLSGGILGLLFTNPCNTLEKAILKANGEGWSAVQIMPHSDSNLAMAILKLIVLFLTLFLWTWGTGYIVLLEHDPEDWGGQNDQKSPSVNQTHQRAQEGTKSRQGDERSGLPGRRSGPLSDEDVTRILKEACSKLLGIKETQMSEEFNALGVSARDLDTFFDNIEDHGFYIPPIDRDGIRCATDAVKFILRLKR